MTGLPGFNYAAFFDAERELLALGHEPLNPARNDGMTVEEAVAAAGSAENPAHPWEWYLNRDLHHVLEAEALLLLPGWQNSRGATLETHVATALSKPLLIMRDGVLMPRLEVIGISGYARSGKDTIGQALATRGFQRVSFADNIREALLALNPLATPDVRIVDLIAAHGWEVAKDQFPEVRALLQRLGSEVGRNLIDPNIWVDLTFKKAPDGAKIVVTDCRFPNEARAVKELGGQMWRVARPGFSPTNAHPSETALDDWNFDHHFDNVGTMEDLHAKVYDRLDSDK